MNGLGRSEQFYRSAGRQMIHEKFPEYEERIAVGLSGQGSDCAGFDDAVSADHDLKTGFCLWLNEEDEEKIGFPLMRAYTKLVRAYDGIPEKKEHSLLTGKYGVMTTGDFFRHQIGRDRIPATWQEWFFLPEHALFNATNGRVFRDDLGEFSDFRDTLINSCPEDVRNKKTASHLALAAQAGQYNYSRCLKHGEAGAAIISLAEFANHILFILFELNKQYTPFYKWRFRAAKSLPEFSEIAVRLEQLLTAPDMTPSHRTAEIELIAAGITRGLNEHGLSDLPDEYYLEAQANRVMKTIRDPEIKMLHLMEYGE
jgi:hypothetical protein